MASLGPTLPGSAAVDSSIGSWNWTNPDNIKADDGTYTSSTTNSEGTWTYRLRAYNFGFAVPSGATIDGIVVELQRKGLYGSSLNWLEDYEIKLSKDGTTYDSTNKAAVGTKWPTSEAAASYGGASDKWGLTWSGSDINSSDFSVGLSAKQFGTNVNIAYADCIKVTVYYTIAGVKFCAVACSKINGVTVSKFDGVA